MIRLSLTYDLAKVDPEATLIVPWDDIEQIHLSVACRAARNRTALYQRKHQGARLATRERDPELAALNRPIAEHFELLQEQGVSRRQPVLGFPISDLTANPLRPHYHALVFNGDKPVEPKSALRAQADDSVAMPSTDARLFYLEDEPIGKVPYTLLLCFQDQGRHRFAIYHHVVVGADGSLPEGTVPEAIRRTLKWWAACPPLLIDGNHSLEEFAIRDYDLRHVFGFVKGSEEEQRAQQATLREIYRSFPRWDEWCTTIRGRLSSLDTLETGYHAALGVSRDELILAHRIATIPKLAEDLKGLGVGDAVLLDSGGSCAIWASWANGGEGGVLASHWNFRPARGAVVFLGLNSNRAAVTSARQR